ncbi:MAG: hypothetical protein JNK31_04325, partial [Candidatus Competibacter sp.]|nr:hypothetical protein [Candidatus Competibacter sp.]
QAQTDKLLDLIAARAREWGIEPGAIAGRRDVEALLAGEDSALRHGWRAAVVGRDLLARSERDEGA